MAHDLYEALPAVRELIDQADGIVGYRLSQLMFEGPDESLTETVNAQPAIFLASVAALRSTRLPDDVAFVAGHSVGEYAALVAAGAVNFADGLRLVQRRGQLMQRANSGAPGGMLAALGVSDEAIVEACASVAPLVVGAANFNAPGQTIISGEERALEAVTEALKARGARRVVRLNVSAAFHSPLMEPAAAELREEINQVTIHAPRWPVVGNVQAEPLTSVNAIREELGRQIAAPVLWEASIRYMLSAAVTRLVEIGPGKILTGLAKRIDPNVETVTIGDLESVRRGAG